MYIYIYIRSYIHVDIHNCFWFEASLNLLPCYPGLPFGVLGQAPSAVESDMSSWPMVDHFGIISGYFLAEIWIFWNQARWFSEKI